MLSVHSESDGAQYVRKAMMPLPYPPPLNTNSLLLSFLSLFALIGRTN